MSATTENPFFKSFAKHLVSSDNTAKIKNQQKCPENQPKNKIAKDDSCAGQASQLARSTADIQRTMANANKGDITNQMAASGVNVQGCITNNFDTNMSVGYGLASGALADDTTVGCEEGKDCFKSNFDSNLGGMVSDRFASDTELPMVNMSRDKLCSAIQGTCLGLSGMCGFPDASGKYKKEYADDEKKALLFLLRLLLLVFTTIIA